MINRPALVVLVIGSFEPVATVLSLLAAVVFVYLGLEVRRSTHIIVCLSGRSI